MRTLPIAFTVVLSASILAACGGGGSGGGAIQTVPTQAPPTITSTGQSTPTPPSSALSLVSPAPAPPTGNVGLSFLLAGIVPNWVQGGVGLLTVSIKSGALPAGLSLGRVTGTIVNADDIGNIAGIPTTVSATTVVFTVKDSGNPPRSVNVPILIAINPMLPLTISPASGALPNGILGEPYNRRRICIAGCIYRNGFYVSATGGFQGLQQPYTFSWLPAPGSSLVPGLSITSVGFISGTPTMAGTYNFNVTVTDFESPPVHVSANYSIVVFTPSPSPSPSPSPTPSA